MTTRRIDLLPPATLITNAEHDFSSGHLTFNRHLPTGPVDGMLDRVDKRLRNRAHDLVADDAIDMRRE